MTIRLHGSARTTPRIRAAHAIQPQYWGGRHPQHVAAMPACTPDKGATWSRQGECRTRDNALCAGTSAPADTPRAATAAPLWRTTSHATVKAMPTSLDSF